MLKRLPPLQFLITLAVVIGIGAVAIGLVHYREQAAKAAPELQELASSTKAQAEPHQGQVRERQPGQPPPYHGELRSLASVNVRDAVLDVVSSGLEYPWAMELISPSEALVSEFAGTLQRVSLTDGSQTQVMGMPDIPSGRGQIGLMDIALHPD